MQPYEKYLKENSQKLRNNQTDAENKLWQRINRDQLLGFRFNRQKQMCIRDRFYITFTIKIYI